MQARRLGVCVKEGEMLPDGIFHLFVGWEVLTAAPCACAGQTRERSLFGCLIVQAVIDDELRCKGGHFGSERGHGRHYARGYNAPCTYTSLEFAGPTWAVWRSLPLREAIG